MAKINNERDALNEIYRLLTGPDEQTRDQLLVIVNQGLACKSEGGKQDSKTWTDSSTINKANYSALKRVLTIHFVNGNIYEYFDVHPIKWSSLLETDSPGRYFNTDIKQHENKKVN